MVDLDDDDVGGRRRTIEAQRRTAHGRSRSKRPPTVPRRRRSWRPRWQGVARLGLLIGLVAFGTVVFSGVRERKAPAVARVIDRLDPDAVIETLECDHAQDVGDQENFVLSGGLCSTYENGSIKIVNGVTLVVAKQPDRDGLTVTGTAGLVNGDRTEVTFTGDVWLTVTDGLVVHTDTLVYSKEQGLATMHDDAGPTTLTRAGLEAEGRDVVYDNDRAIINLDGAATVRLTGDDDREAVVIRSAHAILANADRYMRFEGDTEVLTGPMVIEAETTTAYFGEEETALERLELRGSARIYPTESTSGELRELNASDMTLTFEETTRAVARATLSGDASIHSPDPAPGGLRGMRAREMTVTFDETTGTVEQAMLAGQSTIELVGPDGGAGTRINAVTIDVTMAPDGGDLTALVARDDVSFELEDTQDGPAQEIRAQTLTGTGAPDAGLTGVRFEGGVEYREWGTVTNTGAAVSRVIRAERLEAGVEEGLSALVEARFLGDVLFGDDTRQVSADEAVYDLAASLVTLNAVGDAGSAVTLHDATSDATSTIDVIADVMTIRLIRTVAPEPTPPVEAAPEPTPPVEAPPEPVTIPESVEPAPEEEEEEDSLERSYSIALVGHEVTLDGSTIEASGRIKNVLTPVGGATAESTSGMPALLEADQQVFVSADAIRYEDDTGQTTYTGRAHLWQGDTSFEGDTLTIDDKTGNLTASGNVRTSIQLEQLSETTGLREMSTTDVVADTFVYDDAAHHAVYTKAQLSSGHTKLKADTIHMFLGADGRTLDRLEATGNVTLGLDGRWTTGEHLVYYDLDGRYDLEGAPVVYEAEVEPEDTATTTPVRPGATPPPPSCRRTEGRTLTFDQSSDTVAVDGLAVLRIKMISVTCTPLVF